MARSIMFTYTPKRLKPKSKQVLKFFYYFFCLCCKNKIKHHSSFSSPNLLNQSIILHFPLSLSLYSHFFLHSLYIIKCPQFHCSTEDHNYLPLWKRGRRRSLFPFRRPHEFPRRRFSRRRVRGRLGRLLKKLSLPRHGLRRRSFRRGF